jgi:hypothetical protein
VLEYLKLKGEKDKTAAQYVEQRSRLGFTILPTDLLIVLSARLTLRRNIILLQINDGLVIQDNHLTLHELLGPGTLFLGVYHHQYFALFRVLRPKPPFRAMTLHSSSKTTYEVGFVAAGGNSLFRALVLLCRVHEVEWRPKIIKVNGHISVAKNGDTVWFLEPMKTVMTLKWNSVFTNAKTKEFLYIQFVQNDKQTNFRVALCVKDLGINSCRTMDLDETLPLIMSVRSDYTPRDREQVEYAVEFAKSG